MKKMLSIMLLIMLLFVNMNAVVFADGTEWEQGAYYQMGTYNGEAIIWRCVSSDDPNGTLMVSDKILCFKAANAGSADSSDMDSCYGDGFWENSTIRAWLNSTKDKGMVEWGQYPPDEDHIFSRSGIKYSYADESGFMSDENFTESEKSVIKTVSQWQALPVDKLELSQNGIYDPFIYNYSISIGRNGNEIIGGMGYEDLAEGYKGAMYRICDSVFLLNEPQAYGVYRTLGTLEAECAKESNEDNYYWLRSPAQQADSVKTTGMTAITTNYSGASVNRELGIRPAFYLNELTAVIKSGKGTKDDPYILDGAKRDGISVFINGKQVEFQENPTLENDRTLVGMRAVFEALGAAVEWDGTEKIVTATTGGTTIKLQIDNNIMQINDEAIELDTPARLINDNTMVPIRAVSEAFGADVYWIGDLQRIVIDVQPEWAESDWNPSWYQQAIGN